MAAECTNESANASMHGSAKTNTRKNVNIGKKYWHGRFIGLSPIILRLKIHIWSHLPRAPCFYMFTVMRSCLWKNVNSISYGFLSVMFFFFLFKQICLGQVEYVHDLQLSCEAPQGNQPTCLIISEAPLDYLSNNRIHCLHSTENGSL